MVNNRSIYILLQTSKRNIGIISSFLDGLEYLGFSRTVDENKGLVQIISPLEQRKEVELFLKDLNNWIRFKVINKTVDI